jgi:hypothetical protein
VRYRSRPPREKPATQGAVKFIENSKEKKDMDERGSRTKSPNEFYYEQQQEQASKCAKLCPPIEQSQPIIDIDSNGTRAVGARIFGQSFMNASEVGNADRRLGSRIDHISDWIIVIGIFAVAAVVMGIVALCS